MINQNKLKHLEEYKRGDILISPRNRKVFIYLRKENKPVTVSIYPPSHVYYHVLYDVRMAHEIVIDERTYDLYFSYYPSAGEHL